MRIVTYQLYLFIILGITTAVFSQSKVIAGIPNTPEGSNFQKYFDSPVNYSSGIPDIKIPIYTIQENGLTIPVYLSYHSGGIKVEEVASCVGLGWSLHYGGAISREVRGLPDDGDSGGIGYLSSQIGNILTVLNNAYNEVENGNMQYNRIYNYLPSSVQNKKLDLEPDLYHFNTPSTKGSYFFDATNNNKIIFTEKNNHRIVGHPSTVWSITDDHGTKYEFNSVNTNHAFVYPKQNGVLNPSYVSDKAYKTLWNLSQIVLQNGQNINFNYLSGFNNTVFLTRGNEFNHTLTYIKNIGQENLISTILSPSVKIVFEYQPREDIIGKRLNKIKVFDQNNTLRKQILLHHSYYQSDTQYESNSINLIMNSDYRGYKRLMLDSVSISSAVAQDVQTYQLEYYKNHPFPHRLSTSQDYWGYFNDRNNGEFYLEGNINNPIDYTFREINCNLVKTLSLKKIIYPLGGSKEFIYANNRAVNNENYHNEIDFYSPVLDVSDPKEIIFTNDPSINSNTYSLNGNEYSTTFIVQEDVQGLGNLITQIPNCYNVVNSQCNYQMSIHHTDLLGQTNITSGYVTSENNMMAIESGTYTIKLIKMSNNPDPNMQLGGNDVLISPPDENYQGTTHFYVQMNWKEQLDNNTNEMFIGGLRIEKIITKDNNGNSYSQSYDYTNENGISSGKVKSLPAYQEVIGYVNNVPVFEYNIKDISGQGRTAPFYTTVKEYASHFNNAQIYKGMKVYKFSFSYADNEFYKHPFPPISERSYYNNKLLNQSILDSSNQPLSITLNTYKYNAGNNSLITPPNENEINNEYSIPCFYIGADFASDFWSISSIPEYFYNPNYSTNKLGIQRYYLYSDFNPLLESFEKKHFDTGDITTTTYNTYEGANPLQLSSQTTTSSTGEVLEQKFYYPQDLLSESFLSSLVTQNRIATPVKTETFRGTMGNMEKLSETHTKYKDFDPSTEKQILPSEQHSNKGISNIDITTTTDRKITYDKYDDKSNILQYTLENGTAVSIIWGYNGQYPLAKIEGATYSQIQSAVINLQTLSANDDDSCTGLSGCEEANLRNALNQFRINNPSYLISTYTYDPLIGVTSIMASDGTVQYYQYDGLGRLKQVKDQDGNVLKEMEYHYQEVTN